MKKIISTSLVAILLSGLSFGSAFAATDRTFGSGSLIIPMDGSVYQPDNDGGLYEAYGFIYKLLNRKAADGVTADPIPIYWIIDDEKTSISADDFVISNSVITPVAKEYKAGGTVAIAGITTKIGYSGGPFVIDSNYATAAKLLWTDGFQDVNLHEAMAPFTASVQREMFGTPPKMALMNDNESRTGNATKILEAYLKISGIVNPAADVNGKPCDGTPVSGEGCIYDVLTPYEIGGIQNLAGSPLNGKSILFDYTCSGCSTKPKANYSVLWAPHWVGYEKTYVSTLGSYASFNPAVGTLPSSEADVHDIVMAIRDFIDIGNSLFAECASIETFEWSKYGRFISKFDIGHNGGTNTSSLSYTNKDALDQPYVQVGDLSFYPVGGHLHNWRPFQKSDTTSAFKGVSTLPVPMAFDPSSSNPKSTFGQSDTGYDSTVTVFTYDDPSVPAFTSPSPDIHVYKDSDSLQKQWHYYVGGHMDGDPTNGFVVYLGGHSYVECLGSKKAKKGNKSGSSAFDIELTFDKDMSAETNLDIDFTFKVDKSTYHLIVKKISAANITFKSTTSGSLKLDLTNAAFSADGKKITGFNITNINKDPKYKIDLKSIKGSWKKGGAKMKDIVDDIENINIENKKKDTYSSGKEAKFAKNLSLIPEIVTPPVSTGKGGYNSGCTPKGGSGAAIRYVLNTVFQLDAVADQEFVRSSPIVFEDFLYQGSFDYPGFGGHFKKFQVNATLGGSKKGLKIVDGFGTSGDTAPLLTTTMVFSDSNGNQLVDSGELSGRNIYASTEVGLESGLTLKDNFKIKPFKFENASLFQSRMGKLSTLSLPETQDVISKRYGMEYDLNTLTWAKKENVMGGIEHSAPVIIGPSSLTNDKRPSMTYVGALDGMIHAFKAGTKVATSGTDPGETSDAGEEVWAFIPSSQLPRLQYFRDPNALSSYPAVDASLTFMEAADPNNPSQYLTILLATMGISGNSLVALDVTDPTALSPAIPKLLWERSGIDVSSGKVIMGSGSKVAIGQVKLKSGKTEYRAYVTSAVKKEKQACQDIYGVPLTDGSLCGGLQVFSFDLFTGEQKWRFERIYNSSLNNIPGSLSLIDVDQNDFDDYVAIGDMEGNLWLLPTVPDYDKNGTEDTVIKADSIFDDPTSYGASDIIYDINPLYAPSRDEATCSVYPATPSPCYQSGHDQPIAVSASIIISGGRTTLVWGTGGTDWASNTDFYSVDTLDITAVDVYNIPASKGTLKNKLMLDQGEKVYGEITFSEGFLFFGTSFGQVDGVSPKDDLSLANKGNIRGIELSNQSNTWKYTANAKFRGSVFVSRGELYATSLDGQIIDLGDGTFDEPSALKWYKLKSWRQIFNILTNE